jgi:hypothetical protein
MWKKSFGTNAPSLFCDTSMTLLACEIIWMGCRQRLGDVVAGGLDCLQKRRGIDKARLGSPHGQGV